MLVVTQMRAVKLTMHGWYSDGMVVVSSYKNHEIIKEIYEMVATYVTGFDKTWLTRTKTETHFIA